MSHGIGGPEALAGLDLETPGMQRALDLFTVEPAIAQERVGVAAEIVGGVNFAFEIVERDLLAADGHAFHLPFANRSLVGDAHPFAAIVLRHRTSSVIPRIARKFGVCVAAWQAFSEPDPAAWSICR